MVRFSGGKCTVKLSVTDLEYTAGTVAETSHSAKQRSHIQQYTIESVEGLQNEVLPEAYIRDPEDGMSTHFLGKNKHIPFLMAQAGCNTVDTTPSEIQDTSSTGIPFSENSDKDRGTQTVTYTSLNRGRVYTPPSKPKALCLTAFLDPKLFISLEPKYRTTVRDIKIDDSAHFGVETVYLNGHFFDSELIRYGYATRNSARTQQIVRFTGFRINRKFEKPWIIVPSGQDPHGVPAQYQDRGSDAAGRRWHAVSNALLLAADRAGRSRDGERSVLGDYLESLASLPMQPEVAGVQKPGSADFGVIDVVLSWTKGTRANLAETYLGRPMVTIVEGHEYVEPVDFLSDATAQDTASRLPSPDTAPRTPTSISTRTDLLDDSAKDTTTSDGNAAAYPSPTSCAQTPPTFMTASSNTGRSTIERSLLVASSSRKRTRSASISGPESQSKRPKQTLEQEIASIQRRAEEDSRQRKASKAGSQSTRSDVKRKHRPITIDESSTDENLSSGSLSLVEKSTLSSETEEETNTTRLSERAKSKLPASAMRLRPPKKVKLSKGKEKEAVPETITNPAQRSRTKATSAGQPHDAGFVVPELSRDCVITYAPAGLVRNVGPARKTFMVEEGAVIYGVRFVVG